VDSGWREDVMLAQIFQEPDDLLRFGKAASLVLGKGQAAIGADVIDAAAAGDQFHFGAEGFLDGVLQPGGARQVISLAAVGDGDLHGKLLAIVVQCGEIRGGARRPVPAYYYTR